GTCNRTDPARKKREEEGVTLIRFIMNNNRTLFHNDAETSLETGVLHIYSYSLYCTFYQNTPLPS
ncbi:MAG: hypothetical protein J6C42_05405, partial [Clostridia bacterium]|nr:hypothetical protein [Clostridia bacterium]